MEIPRKFISTRTLHEIIFNQISIIELSWIEREVVLDVHQRHVRWEITSMKTFFILQNKKPTILSGDMKFLFNLLMHRGAFNWLVFPSGELNTILICYLNTLPTNLNRKSNLITSRNKNTTNGLRLWHFAGNRSKQKENFDAWMAAETVLNIGAVLNIKRP